MRVAMTGPVVTAMLAIGAPMQAAPMVMPCDGCALPAPSRLPRPSRSLPHAAPPYDELFRAGHVAARGLDDRWAEHLFQADDSGFSIRTVRSLASRPAGPEVIGARRDRLSAGSMTVRYAADIGPGDSLSLGINAGMEKRRFALDLARGHHIRSQSIGLVASWTRGSAWRLESGYRADFGNLRATMLERGIELAEGAPRSQRGPWSALSYTIGRPGEAGSVSLGLRAQALRLAESDRLALGAPNRADNRIAFTTSFRLR